MIKTIHIPRRFVAEAWGGTETVVLETTRQLCRQGHPASIFTSQALSPLARETMEEVEVRRFPHFYPYWGLSQEAKEQLDRKGGNLFSWALLAALWREPRVNLFHLHTGKRMGGIARLAAWARNIPYLVSLHGGITDVPAEEARTWTEPTKGTWEWGKLLGALVGSRRLLQDAGALLCLGRKEQSRLQEQYPRTRVELFPNGVDFRRFSQGRPGQFRQRLGLGPEKQIILSVARLDPQKNQLLAIETLGQILPSHPHLHLVLAGPVTDPVYHETLLKAVQERLLGASVTFCGSLSGQELVDAYADAWIFLLPSRHEPFGIVILEAWAAGLPVVASAVGGIVDLAVAEQDALLFDPQRGEMAAAQVELLLNHPSLAERLAQSGRKKAQQHGWDVLCGRLLTIYEEVIRAHSLRE